VCRYKLFICISARLPSAGEQSAFEFFGRRGVSLAVDTQERTRVGFSRRHARSDMKRDYPEHPIIGVGAVIVEGDRVLLVRRDTEPLRGEWSVPGGMLELGEKLRDGVRREVEEETGIAVEPGEVLDVFDSIFTDTLGRTQYHYVLIDYLCRVISGEARAGSDVSDVRWVGSEALPAMELRESIEQVVRKGLLRARDGRAAAGR
jgi:8-oxo-dGTP diphosphatase